MEYLSTWVVATWWTLSEMAPYLLLGFLVAGILSVWLSPTWVERHLGGGGLWPTIKASVLGVPLPLCSCGVIPVAASLRQHGAGKGATTSFLLSTPQTGIDSILATYALLGPLFAVLRPFIALISGIVGGVLVSLTDPSPIASPNSPRSSSASTTPPQSTCCGGKGCTPPIATGWRTQIQQALRYGLITLPNDLAKPLIFGILLAGLIAAIATPGVLEPWLGGGVLSMGLMLLIGMPLYVCSTGSIPLALSFLHLGASPGAALVFLIAGPATNAATLSVVWKILGPRTALVYLGTVALIAMGSGLVLDALVTHAGNVGIPHQHLHTVPTLTWIGHMWAGLLVLTLAASMWLARRPAAPPAATGESLMNPHQPAEKPVTFTLSVKGMTCSHCVAAVTRALREVGGVHDVQVSLADGTAVVTPQPHAQASLEASQLVEKVEALGYQARWLKT